VGKRTSCTSNATKRSVWGDTILHCSGYDSADIAQ
jgi:hypothetical protein